MATQLEKGELVLIFSGNYNHYSLVNCPKLVFLAAIQFFDRAFDIISDFIRIPKNQKTLA